MATDSSQIEKAQSICYEISQQRFGLSGANVKRNIYLDWSVLVWEQNGENGASSNQVLYFERVEIRVVGWLVVVEHEVDGICRAANKDNLEEGVPQALGRVGPE